MAQRHAAVIGAGIGGLSAALALHRRGWRVIVFERAAKLEPIGAGIALAPNAVKALDSLGLVDWAGRAAVIQNSGGVRRPDGSWLMRTDLGQLAERFGRPLLIVPRPELVATLVDRLPEGALQLGTALDAVEASDFDVVVGADGIRSATRAALFPQHPGPSYAGFTAWRMIAPVPVGAEIEPSETWGRGAVVGIVPLSKGRVYCYATANLPPDTSFPDEQAELARRFADWHDPIPELIRTTPGDALLRNDIWSLDTPLTSYHSGNIALLGDAAHAMTPNLGQGGCQAIEDAVVLAHRLGDGRVSGADDIAAALDAYTADRRARTVRIAKQSTQIGRLQQMESPLAIAIRDTAIKLAGRLGPGLMLRQMAPVAGWEPPTD